LSGAACDSSYNGSRSGPPNPVPRAAESLTNARLFSVSSGYVRGVTVNKKTLKYLVIRQS
jgi:hypothetical protein